MKFLHLKIKRIFAAISCILFCISSSDACTSAIISAGASASGRPMLWKHRDTSTTDNKIEYVAPKDGCFGYVALFNANDRLLEEAWIGMNEKGFAIMNTATYNIKNDKVSDKEMDKEGFLMSLALQSCVTVEQFEELLGKLPRPMGVEANFAVIDAYGDGGFYETNNTSFVKYDLKDSEDGIIVRTNYSHSGRPGEGYGYIRESNALHLFEPIIAAGEGVNPEDLTEKLSRSFYHDLRGEDALEKGDRWVVDEDFIPRYKSTATIVIEGCIPIDKSEEPSSRKIVNEYIMWAGLGYPPCSEIVPVWCHKDGVREDLRGLDKDGTSSMCNMVKKRRAEVFPYRKGGNTKYIDLNVLSNEKGTGYIQQLIPKNMATYSFIKSRRDSGLIDFLRN